MWSYGADGNVGLHTDLVNNVKWQYQYDLGGNVISVNGNIETVSEGTTQKAKYYYDELNQLIREDNAWLGKTIAYTYDNGGNIQLVEEYTLTSGALDGLTATNSYSYLYGDSNWKDKLTSYNGNTITYDQIGNPISYYNGNSFVWEDGRQLAGIETASGDGIFYLYNSDGIRTFKMVGTTVTNYTLEGDKVVHETNGTDEFWYYYDESGNLVSFELNGTSYYYVKNLQGDIIAITDDSGNKVVEYTYDSWGKLISTTGTLAETVGVKNPYRYRGYRYDTETCLYYLQSRYYDPEIRRFINADSYVDTGDTVLSTNMFAYCENDAVNGYDPSGEYNRKAALTYAKKWYNSFNHEYYKYTGGGDCANFVSQCLYAGGFKMNAKWHSYRKYKPFIQKCSIDIKNIPHRLNNLAYNWDVTSAWSQAPALYNYYKSKAKKILKLKKSDLLILSKIISKNHVKAGDLMFFCSNGSTIDHATMISYVSQSYIYYTSHTIPRWNRSLWYYFNGTEGKPNGAAIILLL